MFETSKKAVAEKRTSLTCAGGSLVALLAGVGPAAAAPIEPLGGYDSVVRVVSTQGLDLGTAAGQALLQHRLEIAARHACADVAAGGPRDGGDFHECFERAMAGATAQARPMIASAQRPSEFAAVSTKP